MVFEKLKEMFSGVDEKYEVLYYKYSKLKLENDKLKENYEMKLKDLKYNQDLKFVKYLIETYENIESAKEMSFKVDATNPEIQKLLMEINKVEKELKKVLKEFFVEEVVPEERMFDPDLHEIATYSEAKGMKKGIILKTTRKGFKFKSKLIKKPKVVVTR